jgi:hypothetical protein
MGCCGWWGQWSGGESCPVSIPVPDLPSPFPTVGARRQTGKDPAPVGYRTTKPWAMATGRRVHRCLLHDGEKRGPAVGPTKRGKGTKIIAISNDHSLPLVVSIQSASQHESQLVEEALGQSFLDELPVRSIGDAAYDSDPLDAYLQKTYDIELTAPHKKKSQAHHAGWSPFSPLPQTPVRGATLGLAALVSSAGDSLGVSR